MSFESEPFGRRRLTIDPFKRIAIDHDLFIEGSQARQRLSDAIHLIRFEITVAIEEFLFQREQFGGDVGWRNNANSWWVPLIQVNSCVLTLVAGMIDFAPKA